MITLYELRIARIENGMIPECSAIIPVFKLEPGEGWLVLYPA